MPRDIEERTFEFAVQIVALSRVLPTTSDGRILAKQILRSGTSIGANVEEAEAGYTRDEFAYRMNIALREVRETHYWLRLIAASKMARPTRLQPLLDEADESKKILGSIVSRTRGTTPRPVRHEKST